MMSFNGKIHGVFLVTSLLQEVRLIWFEIEKLNEDMEENFTPENNPDGNAGKQYLDYQERLGGGAYSSTSLTG